MIRPISRLAAAIILAGFISMLLAAPGATMPTLESLQSLVDDGRYQAALTQSNTYLQAHPGNRDARFLRAVALAGQGRDEAAIAAFKALADDYPQRPEPANNLAALYARSGRYDQARQWLEKALATQAVYAIAHRNLGDIYTALATMAYSQVLNTDGDPGEKGMQLALVNHLYYPREAGVPVPPDGALARATQDGALRNGQDGPNDQNGGDMEIIEAPPPVPEPAHPPETTPPEPEPEAPMRPLPEPDADTRHNRSIIQTVRDWAMAWSQQDFDAYIDMYANNFPPGERSREDWLALRKKRVTQKEAIHIQIILPKVQLLSDNRARVTFVQIYESPTYSDRVAKNLLMQRTDAGWRIMRETSSPPS